MTQHYFASKPTSAVREEQVTVRLFDMQLEFTSASGMFSPGKLDKGAEVLIKYAHIQQNDTVLDLGCSYGVVGITLAKHYEVQVTLVDVNQRAIKYAKKNIEQNNVSALCSALVSDGFAAVQDKTFSTILFNPPQHAGKKLCNDLIVQAKDYLSVGGSLQVVCRHNKGGASFEKFMAEQYGNVQTLAKKGGYRVYKSVKEK